MTPSETVETMLDELRGWLTAPPAFMLLDRIEAALQQPEDNKQVGGDEEALEKVRLELASLGWDDASASHHENYEDAARSIRADLRAALSTLQPPNPQHPKGETNER